MWTRFQKVTGFDQDESRIYCRLLISNCSPNLPTESFKKTYEPIVKQTQNKFLFFFFSDSENAQPENGRRKWLGEMFKQTFEMKTAPHSVTQPKKNKIKRDSVIKQVANGRGQQSGAVGRPQVYMYKRRLTPANKTLKCVVPCLFDNEFFFFFFFAQ